MKRLIELPAPVHWICHPWAKLAAELQYRPVSLERMHNHLATLARAWGITYEPPSGNVSYEKMKML